VKYYPAFLNVSGKNVVVVGGGTIAERKVLGLIRAGACVTVISPTLTRRLFREKEKNTIRHVARQYRKGDLTGSLLTIAATNIPAVNSRVAREAASLVNVVDVPAECTFIAPSVVRRGPLTIAISTGGASPAFSKTIRKALEKAIGPDVGEYLSFMVSMRKRALTGICDRKKRERFLKELASEKVLHLLQTKGVADMKKSAEDRLRRLMASGRS
jgi:precorrin-2 dehydrogenase/sirohydrochlorin ferrochelatase